MNNSDFSNNMKKYLYNSIYFMATVLCMTESISSMNGVMQVNAFMMARPSFECNFKDQSLCTYEYFCDNYRGDDTILVDSYQQIRVSKDGYRTLISDFGMCNDSFVLTHMYAQTVLANIYTPIMLILGDVIGRKVLLQLGKFLFMLSLIMVIVQPSHQTAFIMYMLFGIAFYSIPLSYSQLNELVPFEEKKVQGSLCKLTEAIQFTFSIIICQITQNYQWFLCILFLWRVLQIPQQQYIIESPNWLQRNKISSYPEFVSLAEFNNQDQPKLEYKYQKIELEDDEAIISNQNKDQTSSFEMLTQKIQLYNLILLCIHQLTICFIYQLIIFSLNNTKVSLFQSLIICNVAFYFAQGFLLVMTQMLNSYLAVCCAQLMIFIFSMMASQDTGQRQMFDLFMMTMGADAAFIAIFIMTDEMFPIEIKNTVFGICNFSARLSLLVVPFVMEFLAIQLQDILLVLSAISLVLFQFSDQTILRNKNIDMNNEIKDDTIDSKPLNEQLE